VVGAAAERASVFGKGVSRAEEQLKRRAERQPPAQPTAVVPAVNPKTVRAFLIHRVFLKFGRSPKRLLFNMGFISTMRKITLPDRTT